ncbi:alpha-E domain-containing protein [Caulobacter hibisci]|uniref:Alpha-E domain-containing protein n=1 Tax=Caulobacter hibisci TaxID=2035993 RepID=A0ABS0SXM0_9CAUL|nr:alpha-E domain-containing protein [Caulobacter hibisci]MBI1684392.1 alpha-E domain-containing protein [Caulobacter hibisci]
MMLARVADSLYWLGRYIERAEHLSRLSSVMLNATLDQTDSGVQAVWIALSAVGDSETGKVSPYDAARALVLDRADPNSVVSSLTMARENARQVRDQITTETWERLNLLYLRVTDENAETEFADNSTAFLHDVIADVHLFKGAADATMSHGESWRFMMLGMYLERAQLSASLLEVCFAPTPGREINDHLALVSLLRMACALEPYLRVYTAEIEPRHILEFLVFDEDFPRSIRFSTSRIEEHLIALARHVEAAGRAAPERLAGKLKARLQFADVDELEAGGAGSLLTTVVNECARIHEAIYETFVAYPLELRLPA